MNSFTRIIPLLVLLGLFGCEQKPAESGTPDPPQGLIGIEKATNLYKNYSENRAALILEQEQNSDSSFQVARFVTFDYSELKDYMRYLDSQAEKAGVKPESIRVYFGNLGDEGEQQHRFQNTVFFVPMLSQDKAWYGSLRADGMFTPLLSGWDLQPLDGDQGEASPKTRNLAGFLISQDSESAFHSTVLNEGGSGPPPPHQ